MAIKTLRRISGAFLFHVILSFCVTSVRMFIRKNLFLQDRCPENSINPDFIADNDWNKNAYYEEHYFESVTA